MSPTRELWTAIVARLKADTALMALVDAVYDKADPAQWTGAKFANITRGPNYGVDESADCIPGVEITQQIDVWTRDTRRSACDDVVYAVRRALHDAELTLTDSALVSLTVTLWRVVDDPNPSTQHGIVQVVALVEEPVT